MNLRDAIARMGGPEILGGLIGVSTDTVYQWQRRGYVGPKHGIAFMDLLKKFGLKMDFRTVLEGVNDDE